MTDPKITALAREYAEEATKADAGDPNLSATDLNGIRHDVAEYAEEVIQFLLRRFCLVEKSKVLKSLIQARALIEVGRRNHDNIKEDLGTGSERTIYCLFPDLGKEVEG